MTKKLSDEIEKKLNSFSFVTWDRFVYDDGDFYFYGWIDRPKEKRRKDFIVLWRFERGKGEWDSITSSMSKHAEINKLMGLKELDTEPCRRIEWAFAGVKTAIKL